MEKLIKNFWIAGFFLHAINATLFILNFSTKSEKVDDNSIFFEDWTKMKITSENKPPLKG